MSDRRQGQPLAKDDGAELPHLVIKRGHGGRFRVALIADGGRLIGEVQVDAAGENDFACAISKIADLADTLRVAAERATIKPASAYRARAKVSGG